MNVSITGAIVVLLLAANGFFIAAEFALVKAGDMPAASPAGEGGAAARLTLRIQGDLEAYLTTCRLGITIASLGLGWTGERAVTTLMEPLFHVLGTPDAILHASAFAVGFFIFCGLHLVIGEQVPKSFAIRRPGPVSLWVAYPLHLTHLALWGPNWLFNRAIRRVMSLFGVGDGGQGEVPSGEAPTGLVKAFEAQDEGGHGEAKILGKRFEQDQRPISRIMISRDQVHTLDLACDP